MKTLFIDPLVTNLSSYDFLIITSKRAIESLLHFNYDLKNINLFCVGEKTASFAREQGLSVVHTSKGYAKDLISDIKTDIKGKKGLYIRPKEVANRYIIELLESVIVYETLCTQNLSRLIQPAILLFSAPSQIQCFLKNFSFHQDDDVIVIGETTANALPKEINYTISSEKSLQSLREKALFLQK